MSEVPYVTVKGTKVNPALQSTLQPISSLRPSPDNARVHEERNLEAIMRSLNRWGFQHPIVTREDGEVIAGHGRLESARILGWELVPVITFKGGNIDVAAFAIADNRTGELSTWDADMLAGVLAEIKRTQSDLLEDTGFDMSEFENMNPVEPAASQKFPDTHEIRIADVPPSQKDEVLAAVRAAVGGLGLHVDAY